MNQKEFLLIVVSIFFTIIAWIMVDIYKIKNISMIEAKTLNVGAVNMKIDTQVLEKLKAKQP